MTLFKTRFYGFGGKTQSLHLRNQKYDPNTQSVRDESFNNGDARDVQDGLGYLFDGVDSQVQIIVSNHGTLYVSAQLEDGSLDSDISITYDTDRYKIEKSNNEAVQNIKAWTVSNATTAEKKSKELESNLFAWFKCDESALDDSFDSSGNGNDGKIANASLSTFHTTSDKFYSWQNIVGYTYDSVNDRYIPRDENNPDKDVQGNNLQYKGKVPYTAYAKDSNCGKFDGVSGKVFTTYDGSIFNNCDFIISYWVNPVIEGNSSIILSTYDSNNSNNKTRLQHTLNSNSTSRNLGFGLSDSNNNDILGFQNKFLKDGWQFVKIIVTPFSLELYIDGVQQLNKTYILTGVP